MDISITHKCSPDLDPVLANLFSSSQKNSPEKEANPLSLSGIFGRYRVSKVPEDLVCPVTHEIFSDPYSNELGHTYEKNVLERLVQEGKPDPLTQQPFSHIFPNFGIRKLLQSWKEQNQEVVTLGFPYLQEKNEQKALIDLETAKKFEIYKNYEDAENSYKEALRFTDAPEIYRQYAELLAQSANTEKTYKAFYLLGRWYTANQTWGAAKECYERAKTYYADREEILKALVEVYQQLGNNQAASTALKELGLAYQDKQLLSKACEAYDEAFKLSKDKSCLEALIQIYKNLNDEETVFIKRKQLFELEIETNPEPLPIYVQYLQLLKANGDKQTADSVKQKREVIIQGLQTKLQALSQETKQLQTGLNKMNPLEEQVQQIKTDLQKVATMEAHIKELQVGQNKLSVLEQQLQDSLKKIDTLEGQVKQLQAAAAPQPKAEETPTPVAAT
jgi:tetratricopeptide (TPR) repeat protein